MKGHALSIILALIACLVAAGARSSRTEWKFSPHVTGIPVADANGRQLAAPFLGGLDVPRPQLVDINGDGKPELFVQERTGALMMFERDGDEWQWRTDRFQDLDIGEWYRFVDFDRDGDMDLFAEMLTGYMRVWQNTGTKTEPRFTALGDTIRDVDGRAIAVDRQNILNAVDIDCNNKLDLFIGRVQGSVDRFEEEGVSRDGSPRFRLIEEMWQGIEVLGPEVTGGSLMRTDTMPHGPAVQPDPARFHGANTLAFADPSGRGVYDLFWGDFFEEGLLRFENLGTCHAPDLNSKPPVRFPAPPSKPIITSGYNAAAFGDVDGDGIQDLVMGVIGGAYGPARTSIENFFYLKQAPRDVWTVVTRRLLTSIDVGSDAVPVAADVNGDGLADLLIGTRVLPAEESGAIAMFLNVGTKTAPAFRDAGLLPMRGEFSYAPAIGDLDGDSLPDLLVGNWRDRLQWFRNTGTRAEPKWTMADTALVRITRGTNTTPALGDIDGDGLLDLVIGESSGNINLYRNAGTKTSPKFELVSDEFQGIRVAGRSAPSLVDVDRDGKTDMLIGARDGSVELWRNVGNGSEIRFERDPSFVVKSYMNATPTAADIRGTGTVDLLIGTSAGGLRWFR